MGSTLVLLLGTVAAGIFLGFLIGKVNARSEIAGQLDDAFQRGKDEAEVEKANLGVALNDELLKLRDGIQNLAQQYDSTVRLVQERLGDSIKAAAMELPAPAETQLTLDFSHQPLLEKSESLAAEILVPRTTNADMIELETLEAESVDERPLGREKSAESAAGAEKAFSLQ